MTPMIFSFSFARKTIFTITQKDTNVVWIVEHGNAEYFRRFWDVILFHKGNIKVAHTRLWPFWAMLKNIYVN